MPGNCRRGVSSVGPLAPPARGGTRRSALAVGVVRTCRETMRDAARSDRDNACAEHNAAARRYVIKPGSRRRMRSDGLLSAKPLAVKVLFMG